MNNLEGFVATILELTALGFDSAEPGANSNSIILQGGDPYGYDEEYEVVLVLDDAERFVVNYASPGLHHNEAGNGYQNVVPTLRALEEKIDEWMEEEACDCF